MPSGHNILSIDNLHVLQNSEGGSRFGQFITCERDSGEEREIVRMHFLTWPDHGVPDSSLKLLQVHLGKEMLTVCKCVGDENCICIVKKNM